MKAKLINEAGEKTYAIIFDKGDEVVEGVQDGQGNRLGAHHV